MDIPWFPAEPGLVDGRRVGNSPQLALLDVNSVLVKRTLGPS